LKYCFVRNNFFKRGEENETCQEEVNYCFIGCHLYYFTIKKPQNTLAQPILLQSTSTTIGNYPNPLNVPFSSQRVGPGVTPGYPDEGEYCIDTVDNSACDASWISTASSTEAALSGLTSNTAYYWQARAVNPWGTTEADSGTWWSFTALPQSFTDVPTTHWAWSWIERLFAAGITTGCGGGNYCPNDDVLRSEMAIFLGRGMNGSSYTPPPATGTVFGDVPVSFWAADWIEQLYADGITGGCGGGDYCPQDPVIRDGMAIFLLRAKHGSSYAPPAATGTVFGDVPISHWAAAWIEQLYAEGISSGCGGGNYCPSEPVMRAEMAVFLVRTFELP
jgi:hypothetical protein